MCLSLQVASQKTNLIKLQSNLFTSPPPAWNLLRKTNCTGLWFVNNGLVETRVCVCSFLKWNIQYDSDSLNYYLQQLSHHVITVHWDKLIHSLDFHLYPCLKLIWIQMQVLDLFQGYIQVWQLKVNQFILESYWGHIPNFSNFIVKYKHRNFSRLSSELTMS